jgi:hypothetical protein
MLIRALISLMFALTSVFSLLLAYAMTEVPHWTRWLVAIAVLEPVALFTAFSAVAVLVPRSGYFGWLRRLRSSWRITSRLSAQSVSR